MEIWVNWLAVGLATLSTMVVGSVWYAPKVFGEKWKQWARVDPKNMASAPKAIGITLVVSFITSYVLAHFIFIAHQYSDKPFFLTALATAFWAWLGFTAARIITHDAFENRRKKLTLLNIAHELVTFLVMGSIIGVLPPSGLVSSPFDYPMDCSDVNSLCHGGF